MEAIWLRIVGAGFFIIGMVVVYTPVKMSVEIMKNMPAENSMEAAGFAAAQMLYFQTQAPRIELAIASTVIGAALYGFGAVVAAIERISRAS